MIYKDHHAEEVRSDRIGAPPPDVPSGNGTPTFVENSNDTPIIPTADEEPPVVPTLPTEPPQVELMNTGVVPSGMGPDESRISPTLVDSSVPPDSTMKNDSTGNEMPLPTPTRAMLQYWSRFKVERPRSSPMSSSAAPSPGETTSPVLVPMDVVPTPSPSPPPVVSGTVGSGERDGNIARSSMEVVPTPSPSPPPVVSGMVASGEGGGDDSHTSTVAITTVLNRATTLDLTPPANPATVPVAVEAAAPPAAPSPAPAVLSSGNFTQAWELEQNQLTSSLDPSNSPS